MSGIQPEHDGIKSICYALAFRPDGTQLIAAVGSRVLMYDACDGDLLHSLKGHKDSVYCVAYSRDGKRFASGGADKTIIIWTHKAEGILKYSHGHSIQCLSYNPVTQQLASGTASDYGIWSPEQKSVSKHRTSSKVLCAAWSGNGQHLALGLYSGKISICDKSGTEQCFVERSRPIWTLRWNLLPNKTSSCLAVGCWDGTLSFYDPSGKQMGKDRDLGFDPCSVSYHDGKYICVGGSNRKVLLYSKGGVKLTTICETSDWIWSVCSRPKHDFVAVGCNDGSILMLQLLFSTVHGLYLEHYAFRDAMTDVVIQHLLSDHKVRIQCRDYIKKIAIYKNRVGVQLSNCIAVYELNVGVTSTQPQYQLCSKISSSLDCNLLVLTSKHLILCQETKLQLYNLDGIKEREWLLESTIRYIKVCGGPCGGEGLLVGMKSGLIVKVWINSNFPVHLYKHTSGIRCLDLSAKRACIAAVDENANVLIYNLQTKQVTFEEKSASSLAWNTEMESMLCYSGNGMLNIKTADFPVHRQKLQGYVVGFQGSKIFCLHHLAMQTIEVPQSTSMQQYVERKLYNDAYQVACLGVSEADWRMLALEALKDQAWEVAHAGFVRIKDVCFLDLLHRLQQEHLTKAQRPYLIAIILAYQGRYDEAAQAFVNAGYIEKAVEMFSDLRMFDRAKALAKSDDCQPECSNEASVQRVQEIIQKQAQWTENTNDHETAADMYIAAGQLDKALAILVEHGPASKLIEVARRLKKDDYQALSSCATLMHQKGQHAHALETYRKMGDFRSILSLHIELEQWDDAFAMESLYSEFRGMVSLPYANWLVKNECFEEAREAYKQAGRPDLAESLLQTLIDNAVTEKRFKAASHSCWLLALELLQQIPVKKRADLSKEHTKKYREYAVCLENAEIYYAYSSIHEFINEPFQTRLPETLFNTARFLVARLTGQSPMGVSMVNVLVTLAKQAEELGCYKVAQHAYARLQTLHVPSRWREKVEVATLVARGRAASTCDSQTCLNVPFCYGCTTTSPLLWSSSEEACGVCSQPVFRSFLTFNQLPMIELMLEDDVTPDEAIQILKTKDSSQNLAGAGFDKDQVDIHYDGRNGTLLRGLLKSRTLPEHTIMRVTKSTLNMLPSCQVIVQTYTAISPLPRFFRVVDFKLAIHECEDCNHFFEQDEWDLWTLKEKCCPFCHNIGPETAVSCSPSTIDSKTRDSRRLLRVSKFPVKVAGHKEQSCFPVRVETVQE